MKRLLVCFCAVIHLASSPALADLSSDLLANYPFNGNASDVTGNGYDGTITDATFTTDRFGNTNSALLFDGLSSDVEVAKIFAMESEQTFTLWVNPATTIGYQPILEKAVPGFGGQVEFQLRLLNDGIPSDGAVNWVVNTDNGATGVFAGAISSTALPVGRWSFLACVIDQANDQVCLYVNGVLTGTGSMRGRPIRAVGFPFRIGKQIGQLQNYSFNGSIDDVHIYNRALSASDVSELFNTEISGLFGQMNTQSGNNTLASIDAVSTPQTQLPKYNYIPPPQSGQNGLIVVTHGWINKSEESTEQPEAVEFVSSTSNSVVHFLSDNGLNNWNVQGVLWVDGADTYTPWAALYDAVQRGKVLGDSIVQGGYTHVHFIAHSVGAGLIQSATEEIKATSLIPVTIHCTFLDAYDGLFSEWAAVYGSDADWAESYFVRDELQKQGWTGVLLANAYNVDVTSLDTNRTSFPWYESTYFFCTETESDHGWPPSGFYSNSIVEAITGNEFPGYENYGFKLSEEANTTIQSLQSQYPPGNGVQYGAVTDLGPEEGCIAPYLTLSHYTGSSPGYSAAMTIESSTGTVQASPGVAQAGTDSPVWFATVVSDTNALNYVSFDAQFTSPIGADGLLTVYWDTNMVGEVDEAAVMPGMQHYNFQFPRTCPNTSHTLGFHVDPFTQVHSTIILTNIATGYVGVSQSPILTATNDANIGHIEYKLTGQNGVYSIQSSFDLFNWTTILYLINTNGTGSFSDLNATNSACRFYRAVSQTMPSE